MLGPHGDCRKAHLGYGGATLKQHTGAVVAGPVPLPTKRHLWTVQRSTFVNKKSREQFEMRIHMRVLDILETAPKTVDALMRLDLPPGVDVNIKIL